MSQELIDDFLSSPPFAVVGASRDRQKYGHRVLKKYLDSGLRAYPVNPKETEILGETCYPDLKSLPEPVSRVSIITPPEITESVVEEAASIGAEILWMQPGAESSRAVDRARELGLRVISGGPCVLVSLSL